jgi:hypothetical protein
MHSNPTAATNTRGMIAAHASIWPSSSRICVQVDDCPALYTAPVAAAAAERYERCWLPLLERHGRERRHLGRLAAPLDVAWVWLVHTLAPTHYAKVGV